ncbi:MAG: PAS domain S-box protein, partial [Thioalkalivibrio sp.]|nr:PAS domain S-box protein [Thioalkalivibrio sp.]
EEVLGRHFSFIFTPEDCDQGMPEVELREAREHGRAEDERWHLRKGGEPFWALGIVSALHDAEGRLTGFSKILRDMTAWKRAEQAMQASEQRLRRMLNVDGVGVLIFDGSGTLIEANDAFLRMTGHSRDEVEARALTWRVMTPPEHVAESERQMQLLAETGRVGPYEKEYFHKDGSRSWMILTGASLGDGTVIEYCIDVDDRRQAEEALRESEDRLKESDRRKDAFLATLAHELRNPLAPIRTGLDLIQALRGDAAACEEPLRIIDRQFRHLVHLVDDLLDVSRISRGKIELHKVRLDLAEVIDAALEISDSGLNRGGQVTVNVPSEPLAVEGDRVRLVQVIANLLNNAAKFTDAGGRIGIRVTPRDERVDIRVQDDGCGIPRERLDKIFEMFSQAEPARGGGLGIGLSLVRGLVEMHGGTIGADSAGPGCGATFTVSLPLSGSASAQAMTDTAMELGVLPRQCRVLVVDDNRDITKSLDLVLTMLGAEVRVAHDGAEAVRIFDDWAPTHVLMDLGMPGMDGYEAARRLRAKPADHAFQLVAMTGWGQEEDRQQVREAGFDEHLVKPVGVAELKAVLSR